MATNDYCAPRKSYAPKSNAFLVLNQLETLQELNSQAVILEIVNRFPNYVQYYLIMGGWLKML